MTLLSAARVAICVTHPLAGAVLAIILLKETGRYSLVPGIALGMPLAELEGTNAFGLYLLATAIGAWAVVLLGFGPKWYRLRFGAVILWALSTATLRVIDQLAQS